MVDGSWAKVTFVVSDRILGSTVELRNGEVVHLDEGQTDKRLFRDVRTGKTLTTREMIAYLLEKTNTPKQQLVKPAALAEAFEKGICVGKPPLDMSFTPGSIELVLAKGQQEIKRITFDVELTVRPQRSS